MENFTAYNPVKLHFGNGVVNELGQAASALGKKAFLIYGKGSVLRNGSYDDTVDQLKKHNIEIVEFNGIKPNPVVSDVDRAAEKGIKEGIDLIVAVGGGSVIDSAKIIGVCIADKVKGWDVMKGKHTPETTIPLISVLTLAATGTEMNPTSVLQNMESGEKIGFRHPVMFPKHSFLDPNYTKSVPANYTAYGIVDLIAHSLEAWFGKGEAPLSDRIVISIIKEAMEIGPRLMNDLTNYTYRERIMWAATVALNDTTLHGRESGDWGVHAIGHVLSYLYDTAHGATLSITYPSWMKHLGTKNQARIKELGKALFNVDTVEDTVSRLEAFFKQLNSPVKISEAGIDRSEKDAIIQLMHKNKVSGTHVILKDKDREAILEMMI